MLLALMEGVDERADQGRARKRRGKRKRWRHRRSARTAGQSP
jgi:hypothetical protein